MRIPSTEFLLRPRVYETPTFWQVASHSGDGGKANDNWSLYAVGAAKQAAA